MLALGPLLVLAAIGSFCGRMEAFAKTVSSPKDNPGSARIREGSCFSAEISPRFCC